MDKLTRRNTLAHERAKAFLALADRLFRRLSLGQIEHEGDAIGPVFEARRPSLQSDCSISAYAEALGRFRLDLRHRI